MLNAAVILVLLHAPDGREIRVNPDSITSMHAGTGSGNKLITEGARCLINLADGKHVAVAETCDDVRDRVGATLR